MAARALADDCKRRPEAQRVRRSLSISYFDTVNFSNYPEFPDSC